MKQGVSLRFRKIPVTKKNFRRCCHQVRGNGDFLSAAQLEMQGGGGKRAEHRNVDLQTESPQTSHRKGSLMTKINSDGRHQANQDSRSSVQAGHGDAYQQEHSGVAAPSRRRKRSWWRFLAGCLTVATASAADPSAGVVEAATKRAVVIGINDYQDKSELRDRKSTRLNSSHT